MPEDEKVPWKGSLSSDWKLAVKGWTWQSIGDEEWAKSGECDRCKHQMTIVHGSVMVTGLGGSELSRLEELVVGDPRRGLAALDGSPLFARCNCSEEHPGRPEELSLGCGACAYIERPTGA